LVARTIRDRGGDGLSGWRIDDADLTGKPRNRPIVLDMFEAPQNLNRTNFPLKSKAKKIDGSSVRALTVKIFCALNSVRYALSERSSLRWYDPRTGQIDQFRQLAIIFFFVPSYSSARPWHLEPSFVNGLHGIRRGNRPGRGAARLSSRRQGLRFRRHPRKPA